MQIFICGSKWRMRIRCAKKEKKSKTSLQKTLVGAGIYHTLPAVIIVKCIFSMILPTRMDMGVYTLKCSFYARVNTTFLYLKKFENLFYFAIFL